MAERTYTEAETMTQRPKRETVAERSARFNAKFMAEHGEEMARINEEFRRAAQGGCLVRTPSWANISEIADMYSLAMRLSADTGVQHHVDHIIPLKGRIVSGLHVSSNLQILTKTENLRKGNRVSNP